MDKVLDWMLDCLMTVERNDYSWTTARHYPAIEMTYLVRKMKLSFLVRKAGKSLRTWRSTKGTEENFKGMVGQNKLFALLGDDNTSREQDWGLDRRETVIELSTRGTVHSDNWYLGLPEQAMARSYHPLGYG
ncbi:MAG: hypothetical protein JOS17DRAFT_799744 [Linnemannia elongata]|nr:MAG: hypothetical protein JOS17DRAFT_799744 [Linnemannia elongata]